MVHRGTARTASSARRRRVDSTLHILERVIGRIHQPVLTCKRCCHSSEKSHVAELKYKDGQTAEAYALEIPKVHFHLLSEAARGMPKGRDSVSFARKVCETAAVELDSPPHIRVEAIGEDSTNSFQIARTRAKKSENEQLSRLSKVQT